MRPQAAEERGGKSSRLSVGRVGAGDVMISPSVLAEAPAYRVAAASRSQVSRPLWMVDVSLPYRPGRPHHRPRDVGHWHRCVRAPRCLRAVPGPPEPVLQQAGYCAASTPGPVRVPTGPTRPPPGPSTAPESSPSPNRVPTSPVRPGTVSPGLTGGRGGAGHSGPGQVVARQVGAVEDVSGTAGRGVRWWSSSATSRTSGSWEVTRTAAPRPACARRRATR